MATLYATETHRGLACTWTGTDLTGILGGAIAITFVNKRSGRTFVGAGTCSNPVVTTVGGKPVSTFNYSPAPSDVVVSNIGEWQMQAVATFGDGTTAYSTPDVLTILPRIQDSNG